MQVKQPLRETHVVQALPTVAFWDILLNSHQHENDCHIEQAGMPYPSVPYPSVDRIGSKGLMPTLNLSN
jgi:hypothetical protein